MYSFAIYRFPNDNRCTLISQVSGTSCLPESIVDIIDKEGYIVAPFRCDDNNKLVLIKPDFVKSFEDAQHIDDSIAIDINNLVNAGIDDCPECFDENCYRDCFMKLSKLLESGALEKVVLSRAEFIAQDGRIDAFGLFKAACVSFPKCYVALFYTPESGAWLVATPELLIETKGSKAYTMALAGTMTRDEYDDERGWSIKNRKEQTYVSDYIMDVAGRFAEVRDVSEPYTIGAAHLKHLRTDFELELKPATDVFHLVDALHPTPAVCGIPRDVAMKSIFSVESSDRRYYTGFSGPVCANGDVSLYVTLRCMNIGINGFMLYSGGGLVNSSDVNAEWRETQQKLQPMLSIIDYVQRK